MTDLSLLYSYSKDLKVLYVEDDIRVNQSTTEIFEDYFSKVECAFNGIEGIEKYNHFHSLTSDYYDIVITDINMPKLNGIDMIKQIKTINKAQEFLVISAYSDSDKLLKLIELGISHFLLKPISLERLNQKLFILSQTLVNKKNEKQYLISKSKNAALGEMIDMIAHQWLAQVNVMKMRNDMARSDISDGHINKDEVFIHLEKQLNSFDHLTQTLNEFRGFFKLDTKKENTSLQDILSSVKVLLKDSLVDNTIDLDIKVNQSIKVNVIANEFKHIFINLIQNSIEAFDGQDINNKTVQITGYINDKNTIIQYIDNAGGLDKKTLENILKPSYSTKKNGTGMGMYLVKLILDKIDADITISNYEDGAKFTIVCS
jgi:YesN/AraC family two-component response regulator